MEKYFKAKSLIIERTLESYLPKKSGRYGKLVEAMRYSVLSGGKRIRPILVLAACEAVGGKLKETLPTACAIELIHSYSLVHDDLPCMDNDDFRRGQASCHKKFGEDTALLVGDALLTLAFKVLNSASTKDLKRQFLVNQLIAEAVGVNGMIGGQMVDIEYQGKDIDFPTLEFINIHKSGDLIAVSLRAGAILGGGNAREVQALFDYGKAVGLLFQIVDDILDKEGYAKALGENETRKHAKSLLEKANKSLVPLGKKALVLSQIAHRIMDRNN